MTDSRILVAVFTTQKHLVQAMDKVLDPLSAEVETATVLVRGHNGAVHILKDHLSGRDSAIIGGVVGMLGFGALAFWVLPIMTLQAVLLSVLGSMIGVLAAILLARFNERRLPAGLNPKTVASLSARLSAGKLALVMRLRDPEAVYPYLQKALTEYDADVALLTVQAAGGNSAWMLHIKEVPVR